MSDPEAKLDGNPSKVRALCGGGKARKALPRRCEPPARLPVPSRQAGLPRLLHACLSPGPHPPPPTTLLQLSCARPLRYVLCFSPSLPLSYHAPLFFVWSCTGPSRPSCACLCAAPALPLLCRGSTAPFFAGSLKPDVAAPFSPLSPLARAVAPRLPLASLAPPPSP